MAGLARPTHLTDVKESSITILSSYHEGADPKSTLLNGVTGDGLSNATLLNTNGYIEFSCTEKIILWACGGYYSDSGGNSGTGKVFIQKKQTDGTYANLKESNCPSNSTTWLNLTGEISAGTYRIATSTSRYPVFSELFAQNVVINKTFILHDKKYKKLIPKVNEITGLKNAVPIMLANNRPSGIASSSVSTSPTYDNYKAFDNNVSTFWSSGTGSPVDIEGHWLQYKFDNADNIGYVELKSNAVSSGSYGLRNFKIFGSNDGKSFIELLSVINHPNNDSNVRYKLNNNESFMYYRLQGKNSYYYEVLNIAEWKMFENPVSPTNAYWEDVSSDEPTVEQFISHGMDNLSLLNDYREVTELKPFPMTNKSEFLGVGEIGKVFSKTIDLKRYFDIRNIRTEVK